MPQESGSSGVFCRENSRMILECSHCGAPLDAKSQGGIIKCNYCDRQHRAQALPVQQQFTPHAWRPPQTWMPPPQYAVHVAQPFVYHQTRSSGCGLGFAVFMVLAVSGVGLAVAFFAMNPKAFGSWDGKSTYECDGTSKATISNVSMTSSLSKVIKSSGLCKLEIRDSDLIGDKVLTAEGSSEIVMIGGSIEMGKDGLEALHSARIELRGVTITLADGRKSLDGVTVMRAENLGKIELNDTDVTMPSKLPGQAKLVELLHAGKAVIDGGEFKGPFRVSVDFASELRASDTSIKAIVEGDGQNVVGITAQNPTPAAPAADPLAAPPAETPPPAPSPQPQQKAPPKPKPTATATANKPRSARCGCKPGDLLCAQKCR
jgi:hypothetical protein